MSHITETNLANLTDKDLFVFLTKALRDFVNHTYTTKAYPLAEVEAAGEELKTLIGKRTIADFDHMGWQILKDGRWAASLDENDRPALLKLSKCDTSSLIDAMQQYVKAQKWLARHAEGVRFYATLAFMPSQPASRDI